MAETVYIAADLGASSGRHVAGLFNGSRIRLAEVHRFENGPVTAAGTMHWDLLGQWRHVLDGLRKAGDEYGQSIRSVGVDTWGVDFALLGRGDTLLGNPVHYRDHRTDGMMDATLARVTREEIFDHTGLQFMPINTLYQLVAMKHQNSPLLEMAETLLMMPDVFHWLLCGVKSNEFTNATTTQFFDIRKGDWARDLLDKLEVPTRMLGPITTPGTRLGKLRSHVAEETGLRGAEVVLPGTHDTASAVLAVPAESVAGQLPDWCYISSGTWSLMGVELPHPIVTPQCLNMNFTNEGGIGGTVRLLKNIGGLWLVQECRRVWQNEGRNFSWDELTQMAAGAPALIATIDPDDPSLLAPANMPAAIAALCRASGQKAPEGEGAIIRCALESLAMKYRVVLERLEQLAGIQIRTVHVVGGGSQNQQLCQMTANACNRPVVAGPAEATAIGNVMMQAISAGQVGSIDQARILVRESFQTEEYTPHDTQAWADAFGRFRQRYGY